jgi:formate hydrogenlyase subunit 3/multisubunit Na+/H+ antiporter MnhD subunit
MLLAVLAFLTPLATVAYCVYYAVKLGPRLTTGSTQKQSLPLSMRWSTYGLAALSILLGIFPTVLYEWSRVAAALVLETP